jgi:hypothetical protein
MLLPSSTKLWQIDIVKHRRGVFRQQGTFELLGHASSAGASDSSEQQDDSQCESSVFEEVGAAKENHE